MNKTTLVELEYIKCKDYLSGKLKNGKDVSMSLLNGLDINPKRVFTYTVKSMNEKELYSFNIGGKFSSDEGRKDFDGYIKTYLKQDESNVILFENSLSEKNDKWLKEAESRIITYDNSLYHLLKSKDEEHLISTTLDEWINAWQNISFFSKLSSNASDKIIKSNSLDKGCIQEIIDNLIAIIVDAYDLEGYLYLEL